MYNEENDEVEILSSQFRMMCLSNTNPMIRCKDSSDGSLVWEEQPPPVPPGSRTAGLQSGPACTPLLPGPPPSSFTVPAAQSAVHSTSAAGPATPSLSGPACNTNINVTEVRVHKTHVPRYNFPEIECEEEEPYDPRNQYQMMCDVIDTFNMRFRRGEVDDMEGLVGRNLEEAVSGPLFFETRRQLKEANQQWKKQKGKLTEAEQKYFDKIEAKLADDSNDSYNDRVARGEFFPPEPTASELKGKEIIEKNQEMVERRMALQCAKKRGSFERKKKKLDRNRKLKLDSDALAKRSPVLHPAARPARPAPALGAGLPAGVSPPPPAPARRARRNSKSRSKSPVSPPATQSDISVVSIHASAVQPATTPRAPGEPRKIIEVKLPHLEDLPFMSVKVGCKRYNNKALATLILVDSAASHSCIEYSMLTKMGITRDQIDTSLSFVLTTVSSSKQSGCILGRICLDIEIQDECGLVFTFQETCLVLIKDILKYPIWGISGQRRRRAALFTGEFLYQNFCEFYALSQITGEEEYRRFRIQSEVNQLTLPDLFNSADINLCKNENKNVEFIIMPEYNESPSSIQICYENENIRIPPQVIHIPEETSLGEASMFTCNVLIEAKEDCKVEQSGLVLSGREESCGGGAPAVRPAGSSSSSSRDRSPPRTGSPALQSPPAPPGVHHCQLNTLNARTIPPEPEPEPEPVHLYAVSLHTKPPPEPGLREDDYVESEIPGEVSAANWEENYLCDQLAISFRDEEDYQRQLKTNQKGEFSTPNLSHLSPEDRKDAQMIFEMFPDAIAPSKLEPGVFNKFKFRIPLKKMPKRDKVRSYTTQHLEAADKLLGELEQAGIVEYTTDPSPCNSPYQLVKKSSDTNVVGRSKADKHVQRMTQQTLETEEPKWRLVLDLRSVNEACAEFPPVATPKPEAIQEDLANTVCTVTDLVSSFFQQEIDERDRWIFAFCHRNKFMRLTKSAQGFLGSTYMQAVAHNVQYSEEAFEQFRKEYDYLFDYFGVDINSYTAINYRRNCFVHGDDNLKKSKDMKHALLDLAFQLFSLERVGLRISGQKSQFCTRRFVFTGSTYSTMPGENFNVINQSRLKALLSYRLPYRGIAELSSRLSILNFYSRWIPGYKIIAAPLYALLKMDRPVWKMHHTMCFNNLRLLLSLCSRLYFPRSDVMKIISSDASILAYSYMAFMCFLDENSPETERLQLVQTDSKLFTLFESKRAVLNKEISALCFALKSCEHLISASTAPVIFLTDAASIIKIGNSDHHSPVMLLASFLLSKWRHLIIQHQPGCLNLGADYATRLFSYHYLKMDKSTTSEYSELNYWIPKEMLPVGTQLDNPLLKHILETSPDRDKWNLDPRRGFPEYSEDIRLPSVWLQEILQHRSPEENFISAVRRGFSCLNVERQHFREIAQPALRLTQAGFNKIFNTYKTQLLKDKLKGLPVYNVRMFYLKLVDRAVDGEKMSEEEPREQVLVSNRVHEIITQAQSLAAVNQDKHLASLCQESHRAAGYRKKSEILKQLEEHLNEHYLHEDIQLPTELDSAAVGGGDSEVAGDRVDLVTGDNPSPPASPGPLPGLAPSAETEIMAGNENAARQSLNETEGEKEILKAVHGVIIPIHVSQDCQVTIDFLSDCLLIRAKDGFTVGPNTVIEFRVNTTVYVPAGRCARYEMLLDSPTICCKLTNLIGLNSDYLKSIHCFSAAARHLPAGTPLLKMYNIFEIPHNPKNLEVRLIGVNCSGEASFVKETRQHYRSQQLVLDLSALCQATGSVLLHGVKAEPDVKEELVRYNAPPPGVFVRPGQSYWEQTRQPGESYQGVSYNHEDCCEGEDPRLGGERESEGRERGAGGGAAVPDRPGRPAVSPQPSEVVKQFSASFTAVPARLAGLTAPPRLVTAYNTAAVDTTDSGPALGGATPGPAAASPAPRPAAAATPQPADETGYKLRSDQLGDPADRGPQEPDLRQADLFPADNKSRTVLNQMILLDTALGQGGRLDNESLQLLQKSDQNIIDLLLLCGKEENPNLQYAVIDNLVFKVAEAKVGSETLKYHQLLIPAWCADLILQDMHYKTEHDSQIYSEHYVPNSMMNRFSSLYYVPKYKLEKNVLDIYHQCYKCRIGRAAARKHRVNRVRNLQPVTISNAIHYLDHAYLAKGDGGYNYCLVIVDFSTGFTCLFPQKTLSSKETLLAYRTVAGMVGCAGTIVCDSANSFGGEFCNWLRNHNVTQYRSTPRRSQQLGLAEEKVKQVKIQLTKSLDSLKKKSDWPNILPSIAMFINMKNISKNNPLNAYNLFFGNSHYVHQGSYLAAEEEEEAAERFREAVVHDKLAAGEEAQRHHVPSQKFRKNQFVHRVVAKSDRESISGTVNLSPSHPRTYQIVNTDSSGTVLQCLELSSGIFTFLHADEVQAVDFCDILRIENSVHHRLSTAWEKHKRRQGPVKGPQFKFFEGVEQEHEDDVDGGEEEVQGVVHHDQLSAEPEQVAVESESEQDGSRESVLAGEEQLDQAAAADGARQLRKRGLTGKVEGSENYLRKKYKGEYLPLEDHHLAGSQDVDCDLPASLTELPSEDCPQQEREQIEIIKDIFSRKRPSSGSLQAGTETVENSPEAVSQVKRKKLKSDEVLPTRQSQRIRGIPAPDAKLYYLAGRARPSVDLTGYLTGVSPTPHRNAVRKIKKRPTKISDLGSVETIELTDLGNIYYNWSMQSSPKKSILKLGNGGVGRKCIEFNPHVLCYNETSLFCDKKEYKGVLNYRELKSDSIKPSVSSNLLMQQYCPVSGQSKDMSQSEIQLYFSQFMQSDPTNFDGYIKV